MEHDSLGCQVCLAKFKGFFDLKKHVRSKEHQKKMEEVFQKNVFSCTGYFPSIVVMDLPAKHGVKQPIIGLSLLTVCFSPDSLTFFYLCHVCEEKCKPDRILHHLSSGDHNMNYFNYTDPNLLSFSWLPSMDMRVTLKSQIIKKLNDRGPEQLQMLDLPDKLLEKCETSTYSEVMRSFSENDKLLKLLKAVKPKRTMIQTYQKDSNRKHPLLGMQHLVECVCVGQTEKTYFLCMLCNITLAGHMIIKHVLSFDHIFFYFKAWHPSTLMSKECYKLYSNSFASMMIDFAEQTEKIHGSANSDMKQVSLEPDVFTSIHFSCFAEALKKLESIRKENKESSLITSIEPGNKLTCGTESVWPVASSYKLRCQNCNMIFLTVPQYLKHVFEWKHQQMLKKLFGKDERPDGYDQTGCKPILGLYRYLKESLMQKRAVFGISLVVTCLSTQVPDEPIYVCFACQDSFPELFLKKHLGSRKHLIHTMLYQNPWQLPFAWKDHLDVKAMKSVAWEEEKERGPYQMMLKILDVPPGIIRNLNPPTYTKVMETFELHHAVLKRQVPRCETYSKLKQNERFPLLGQQFLVTHDVCDTQHQSTQSGFLCLLCKRRLSDTECYAHVFSWEHVATFLRHFHPGSLNASTENAETLQDLAKQAARIHSISHVQVIKLDTPIWEPCTYNKALLILASAKRREGKGKLEPQIIPNIKLVPRETLKEEDKSHVRENSLENSRTMEASVKNTRQKSTDNSETTLKKISVEVDAKITDKCNKECGGNVEEGAAKETPPQIEKESEKGREVFSKPSSEEIKKKVSEKCQTIKEKMGEPTKQTKSKPSEETPKSCQNKGQGDGAETRKEGGKRRKDALTQLKHYMYQENERKTPRNMSEKSQDTHPNEHVEREMSHKRQRLTSKEEIQKMSSSGQREVTTADKGERCKSSQIDQVTSNGNQQEVQLWQYVKKKCREPVIGLTALIECHGDQGDPIYLCECCSLKIPEKDIISHVTGFDHQRMYLVGLQKVPSLQGNHQRKEMRRLAALFEEDKGYGEAQVVDLAEDIYNKISKQNFQEAIQTVWALQAQLDSGRDISSSTSTLSGVQPVGTSVTLNAQQEFFSGKDNNQVVEMEVDNDSEDSEAPPSSVFAAISVMTENTSKTTEVPPESNEDVKMTHIKVPQSADNNNSCLTASRSCNDASSLHLSKSGTNTLCLYPDSTGTNSKAEITPSITVGSLNRTTTSKIVGKCQTAATSDSTVMTPAKSMTAVFKFTSKTSGSTPDTTTLTATVSSCTTATTNLGKTAYKCTAATLSAPATTAKSTAPTSICRATTSKFTAASSKVTATISNTTSSIKSAMASKPLDPRTGAASAASTSHKAAATPHAGSTVKSKDSCRATPASKIEHSKNSETSVKTSSQTVVTSTKMIKTSVKCENTEASAKCVHMKSSVGSNADVSPHIHKSNSSAVPHGITPSSVRSEQKNPHTEQSDTSVSKPESTESLPKVGLNHLIAVLCEGRKQVYCQLCSVRLKRSTHVLDSGHQYNYVKMKFPGLSVKPPDFKDKLDKIVAHLAEVEKGVGSRSIQELQVNCDVYKELAVLPENAAIEKLKSMVRQRDMQVSSSSPNNTVEALGQHIAFASPYEASSPDDGTMQENSEPDLRTEAQIEVTPAIESPAVKVKKPHVCADPLATDLESKGTFAPTADAHQETPENRQQPERNDPELQDTQKELEGTQRKSPSVSIGPDPPSAAAASVTTEQQNPSRPSQKAESGHHSLSLSIYIGGRTKSCSHLSQYLRVCGLKPIIGLGCVWECRGISLKPFFLCESCRKMLSINHICRHIVSSEHQFNYMLRQYPQFLSFWTDNDLLLEMKLGLLKDVAYQLSPREILNKMDAQVVLLGQELYECVRTAPFSEALNMVKNIKKLSISCPAISTPQQKDKQSENQQSLEESFHMEIQSASASETDKSSDNEERQNTRKRMLDEAAMVGDLNGVKQRRILSPPDVSSVPSKANPVDPLYPDASTCLSPQETCRSLSIQPALRSLIHQQQNPISKTQPDLQVKQAEVFSESSSSSMVCPKTSQTLSVFPRDEYPPTSRMPTVASIETQVRPCTNSPQLQDPLAAKCTGSSLQPISQPSPESTSMSTSVNPAVTHAPPSPNDQGTGPGPDGLNASLVDWKHFEHLLALVRESKSKINPCDSAPDNAEITASCATIFSKGVANRPDSKCVQAGSQMANSKKSLDSNIQVVEATVKKGLPSTNSLKGMFSTAAPTFLGYENQQVDPNSLSALNSSLEGYLTRGNSLFRATEGEATGTMLPSAGTANPSDLQHQGRVTAHSMFGNVNQITPIVGYGCQNPGQIPQPQGNTETDSTVVCQLPFKTVTTIIPEPINQQFMDYAEVNRGTQSAVGGYGHFSHMMYVTNGHSGYPSSEAAAGYTTSDIPPVHPGSLYQSEGYPTRELYPRQSYPEQERNGFSLPLFRHNLATPVPTGWVSLDLQQQQLMMLQQQQLMVMQQQQQQQQQQHYSWTHAALTGWSGDMNSIQAGSSIGHKS